VERAWNGGRSERQKDHYSFTTGVSICTQASVHHGNGTLWSELCGPFLRAILPKPVLEQWQTMRRWGRSQLHHKGEFHCQNPTCTLMSQQCSQSIHVQGVAWPDILTERLNFCSDKLKWSENIRCPLIIISPPVIRVPPILVLVLVSVPMLVQREILRIGIKTTCTTCLEMNCHIKWVQHARFPQATDEWDLAGFLCECCWRSLLQALWWKCFKRWKNYNTSNLRKQLLTKHLLEQYTALQQIEKEQAQTKTELLATCSKKQLTIAQVLESGKLYAFDHPRAWV